MHLLSDQIYGLHERREYDRFKVVLLCVDFLNGKESSGEEIRAIVERMKLWDMDIHQTEKFRECVERCQSNSGHHMVLVVFGLSGAQGSGGAFRQFVERWTRKCVENSSQDVYHYLGSCLEWVLDNFENVEHSGRLREVVSRHLASIETSKKTSLLNSVDEEIIESLSNGGTRAFTQLDTQDSTKSLEVPTNSTFQVIRTRPARLLVYSERLSEAITSREDGFSRKKVGPPLGFQNGYRKVYSSRFLLLHDSHQVLIVDLRNHSICHRLSFLEGETVSEILVYDSQDSYVCVLTVYRGVARVTVVSLRSRKSLSVMRRGTPISSFAASYSSRYVKISGHRCLLHISHNGNLDVFCLEKRSFVGTCNMPLLSHLVCRAHFHEDHIMISEGLHFGLYRLRVNFGTGVVGWSLVRKYPNLVEKKCWWDRSVVMGEPLVFSQVNRIVVVHSAESAVGHQVICVENGRTASVRTSEAPCKYLGIVVHRDETVTYFVEQKDKRRMGVGGYAISI